MGLRFFKIAARDDSHGKWPVWIYTGLAWSHAAIYGFIWPCMASYGSAWLLGFSLNEVKDIFELELDIKSICKGEKADKDTLDHVISAIENQMKLIEEKEETLERVKGKYSEILKNLKSTSRS